MSKKKAAVLKGIFESDKPSLHKCRPLAELRLDHGMSMSEMAKAIGMAIDRYRKLECRESSANRVTKEKICQILSCQIGDVDWEISEEVLSKGIKPLTFCQGKKYKFIPSEASHCGTHSDEFTENRKKRLRYVSDSGRNHVFEHITSGCVECFTDAQLMDYEIRET